MTFNFVFTFPEVTTLNDILISVNETSIVDNVLILQGPIFAKPVGEDGFQGWSIDHVEGDLSFLHANIPLTRNNILTFDIGNIDLNQGIYVTKIYCKMIWDKQVSVKWIWHDFKETFIEKIMTVKIDLSDSNPDTCCSYADDAVNMAAGSASWDTFFGHYPVLLKDGKEVVRIDPNNYAKDIYGSNIDITSGNAGDVMVAFPRRGLNISKNGTIITVSFTSKPDNPDFKYYAHTHNGDLDIFYTGAYEGYVDEKGKLRSLSGKNSPYITFEDFRKAAQLNGAGYEQFAFYQLLYLQAMFILKYKTLNGQTALGNGVVTETLHEIQSGTLNTYGMDYGTTENDTTGMKFAGIENFWGNNYLWLDGIILDDNCNYLITPNTFNNSGEGYEIIQPSNHNTTSGVLFLRECAGSSEAGFLPVNENGKYGSSSTYFADTFTLQPSSIGAHGGAFSTSITYGGPFCYRFAYLPTTRWGNYAGRLQKL